MSYITDGELAEYVGTPVIQDTGLLVAAVEAASKQVDMMCRRTFDVTATSATARVYRPDGVYRTAVDDFVDVSGLIVATDDDDDGTFETTWGAGDYELLPVGARIEDGSAGVYTTLNAVSTSRTFPTAGRRQGTVQVTAKWGWAEVPAPVRQATLELAKDLYSARLNRGGLIVTDVGAVSARTNRIATALLAPYVRFDRIGVA